MRNDKSPQVEGLSGGVYECLASMSRVRRQSLIVGGERPNDTCSWGLFLSGGDTKRGTRLTSAKLVGTSQNADSMA